MNAFKNHKLEVKNLSAAFEVITGEKWQKLFLLKTW